jgi:hypothetical protein
MFLARWRAGHRSLQTTQLYIAGSTDAKRKVVTLI